MTRPSGLKVRGIASTSGFLDTRGFRIETSAFDVENLDPKAIPMLFGHRADLGVVGEWENIYFASNCLFALGIVTHDAVCAGIECGAVAGLSVQIVFEESRFDPATMGQRHTKVRLVEVSLTDKPCNRSCKIDRWERVDLPPHLVAKAQPAAQATTRADLAAKIDKDIDDLCTGFGRLLRSALKSVERPAPRAAGFAHRPAAPPLPLVLRSAAPWDRPEHYTPRGYGIRDDEDAVETA